MKQNLIETNKIEKVSKRLKEFRKEIDELISKRKSGKINNTMFELLGIESVDSLIEEDAEMWNKIKNYEYDPIPENEINNYFKKVTDSKNKSREQFYYVIIQKITSLKLNKDQEIFRKLRGKK